MNVKQMDALGLPFDLLTNNTTPQKKLYNIAHVLADTVPTVKQIFYLIKHTTYFAFAMVPDAVEDHDSTFRNIMGFGFDQIHLAFEQAPKLVNAVTQQTYLHILPDELGGITRNLIAPEQARAVQQAWDYESMVFYPLIRPEGVLGFLSLLLDTTDFPTNDLPTIEQFSVLAAQVVETMQLQRYLDKSRNQMSALHAVSLRVSRSLNLAKVMEQAVTEVTRVLDVEAAAISVIEEETGDLVIRAQQGLHAFAHAPVRIPKGKGVAWETLRQQTHTIIESWDNEPRLATPEFREEHVSTTILVPMLTAGEAIGVLSAMSRVPRNFDAEEIQLLNSIADHVAIALKNAALHTKTQQQAHERAFLFNLAATIAPMQAIEDIAEEALQRTLAFMGWPIGTFLIEDSASSALVPQARVGDGDTLHTLILRMRETAYQQNVLHPVIINQAETPPRTIIQIPIQARYRTLGWLILGNNDAIDVPLHIQEVLTTASKHLGIAIENVQLYQEMTEREKSSRALYQITRAMTGHDLTDMLKQTLEELHEGIPYEASGIQLVAPQRMKVMRLRVGMSTERLNDIQARLQNSIGALSSSASFAGDSVGFVTGGRYVGDDAAMGEGTPIGEETQIVLRGREDGVLPDDALLSYLEVPIIQENEAVGAILLARQYPFHTRDQRLLFILAYQLSKVLATVRLFHKARAQTQQLEEANALLRAQETSEAELFNDVAQELRNPVTFVQSYAELLLEETLGALNPAQADAMRMLQQQTEQLSNLVRDLGTIKSINSKTLQQRPTHIAALLERTANILRSMFEKQEQTLTLNLASNLPEVWIDQDRIAQVITILLKNASRISPVGGTITLAVQHCDIDNIGISVSDSGPVLSTDDTPLIFKRLHQGQIGHKYPGIGIGLILARWIVVAHGGAISVKGGGTEGNTFYFTLPK